MKYIQREKVPQWLNEVLSKGYSPEREVPVNDDFSIFSYIDLKGFSFQKMYRFFVIEGLPGAGKTTICQKLSQVKNIAGIKQILPEEPTGDFMEDQSYYFTSDELKTRSILNNISSIYVLDRYYVSTIGYCYASDCCFGTKLFPSALLWYKRGIKNRWILRPFATLLLDVDIDLSLARKERNPSLSDPWANKKFLRSYMAFYDYFFKKIEPSSMVYRINTNRSFENVYKDVYDIVTEK